MSQGESQVSPCWAEPCPEIFLTQLLSWSLKAFHEDENLGRNEEPQESWHVRSHSHKPSFMGKKTEAPNLTCHTRSHTKVAARTGQWVSDAQTRAQAAVVRWRRTELEVRALGSKSCHLLVL